MNLKGHKTMDRCKTTMQGHNMTREGRKMTKTQNNGQSKTPVRGTKWSHLGLKHPTVRNNSDLQRVQISRCFTFYLSSLQNNHVTWYLSCDDVLICWCFHIIFTHHNVWQKNIMFKSGEQTEEAFTVLWCQTAGTRKSTFLETSLNR